MRRRHSGHQAGWGRQEWSERWVTDGPLAHMSQTDGAPDSWLVIGGCCWLARRGGSVRHNSAAGMGGRGAGAGAVTYHTPLVAAWSGDEDRATWPEAVSLSQTGHIAPLCRSLSPAS